MSFCTEIQIGLNNKLTTEDFVKKFGFSDENELKARIIKMFPYKHDDIIRKLKSNDKLAARLRRSCQEKHVSGEVLSRNSKVLETEMQPEIPEESEEMSLLDRLRAQEEVLISNICEEETAHEALIAHKHSIIDTLRFQRTELSRLEATIRKMAADVDDSIIQLSHTTGEIEKSNDRLSSLRQQLETTQAEIKAEEKIVIYVLSDGSIMSDNLALEAEESLYLPLFHELSTNVVCEDLTIKELRQLARLLAITNVLDTKFDILFDSKAVEKAWNDCK